jgi:hypothetical protein
MEVEGGGGHRGGGNAHHVGMFVGEVSVAKLDLYTPQVEAHSALCLHLNDKCAIILRQFTSPHPSLVPV